MIISVPSLCGRENQRPERKQHLHGDYKNTSFHSKDLESYLTQAWGFLLLRNQQLHIHHCSLLSLTVHFKWRTARVNRWLQRQSLVPSRAGWGAGIWECLQTTKVTSGSVKNGAENRCPLIPVTQVTSTSINQTVRLPTYLTVCVQAGHYCRTAMHLLAAPPAPSEWIRPESHFHAEGKMALT